MSKGQKYLPAAALVGLFATIANPSRAIATPLVQSVLPLDRISSAEVQHAKSDVEKFNSAKLKQNESFTEILLSNETEFIPSATDLTDLTKTGTNEAVSSSQTLDAQFSQTLINPPTLPELESSNPEPQETSSPFQSPESAPESSSPDSQDTPKPSQSSPEPQPSASQSNRWHFLFQPYIYIPISIYGDTSFSTRRTSGDSRDFDIESDQIRTSVENNLNFAFLGEVQAWSPNYRWGVLTNVNYLSASSDDTLTRSLRFPGLAEFIPTELQANLDIELWSVDLAAAYRIYDSSQANSNGISTEFDLGPFVLDIVGGANFTGIDTNLDLRTNLGGQADFDANTSVFSPLVGVRLRINLSPRFALVTAGSTSGFGINGLTRWNAQAGIDWMFSGNTSLGLGYRFGYTRYNTDLNNGEDFGLTLNQNGPYLSFSFRF